MVYAVTLLSLLTHGCYIGSRLVASLFALELGANPLQVGVLAGLYAALSLLLAIQAGKLSDRLGPLRPMLLGSALVLFALVLPYAFASINALYVSAVVIGAGFIFFNVSVQSLIALLSTPSTRARNFSILSQGYSLSTLFGPLGAGFAVQHLGATPSYLVLALIAAVPVMGLPLLPGLLRLRSDAPPAAVRSSAFELLRDKPLRSSFLSSGLVVTGWDLYTFYLPVHAHAMGFGAATIGVLLALFGAAAFVARFFLPPLVQRLSEAGLLAWAMIVAALLFVVFPLFRDVYALATLSIALGLTLGLGQPLSMMITYSRAPAARAGEANGVRLMVNHFMHFAVPIASGGLGTAFGVGPVFWLNAACLAFAAKVLRKG
ncbi:MAG: MFS transporter [Burkholderiales bacterium]|nr:MFS transporter [Burkholderiales bacterium]